MLCERFFLPHFGISCNFAIYSPTILLRWPLFFLNRNSTETNMIPRCRSVETESFTCNATLDVVIHTNQNTNIIEILFLLWGVFFLCDSKTTVWIMFEIPLFTIQSMDHTKFDMNRTQQSIIDHFIANSRIVFAAIWWKFNLIHLLWPTCTFNAILNRILLKNC